jgi:hypothetical protein
MVFVMVRLSPDTMTLLGLSEPLILFHVICGDGLPVALHDKMSSLPSSTTVGFGRVVIKTGTDTK